MNIGIVGLGCIGSVLAKYLNLDQSNTIFYFNRSNLDELSITFEDSKTVIPITLSSQEENLDWLIVCLKEYQKSAALPLISNLTNPSTKVAIFRNGLHLSEDVSSIVNMENILETIIDCPVQTNGAKRYIQIRTPKVTLPATSLSNEFMRLFETEEIRWKVSSQFNIDQWEKLIESSSMGSIQAITESPCSIFRDKKYYKDYLTLIDEAIAVAQSEGIDIDSNYLSRLISKLKGYPDTKGSSMLTDKMAGKPLELGAKIGAILKIGRQNKVDIPMTESIFKTLSTY